MDSQITDNDNPFDEGTTLTPVEELRIDAQIIALTLSPEDTEAFIAAEATVRRGLKTFVEVGKALAEISENRWYRAKGYASFAEYCYGEWGIGNDYAYKLMAASEVVSHLQLNTMVDTLPGSERVARPLTSLPTEQQGEAWSIAQGKANSEGRPVTARDAADAVAQIKNVDKAPLFREPLREHPQESHSQDGKNAGQGSTNSQSNKPGSGHNFKPEQPQTPKPKPPITGVRKSWAHTLTYQFETDEGDGGTGVITVRPARESENALPGRYMVEINGKVKHNAVDLLDGMEYAERYVEGLRYA